LSFFIFINDECLSCVFYASMTNMCHVFLCIIDKYVSCSFFNLLVTIICLVFFFLYIYQWQILVLCLLYSSMINICLFQNKLINICYEFYLCILGFRIFFYIFIDDKCLSIVYNWLLSRLIYVIVVKKTSVIVNCGFNVYEM